MGFRGLRVWRSLFAAKTISKLLPEPWKCQISPLRIRPSTTRSTMRLAASYCWNRLITLILRWLRSVANKVKFRAMSRTTSGRSIDADRTVDFL